MLAFRALSHFTLHRRWTTRASKCSPIGYVEGETTFWAFYHVLGLCVHSLSLSINQSLSEILKTFLKITVSKSKYCNLANKLFAEDN
jgi:hypothetical protein